MNKLLFTILLLLFLCNSNAEKIELSRNDYLKLIVSNYIHGFKEFDTTVLVVNESLSIGIYFDVNTQERKRAESMALRFKQQLPMILSGYEWAKDIEVNVNVYSEDRLKGY